MRLAFVTDNGFSEKNGKYYYSGANVQHYYTVANYFDDIEFISRKDLYDASGGQVSRRYHVTFINSLTDVKNSVQNFLQLSSLLEDIIKKSDVVMCFGLNGYFAYKKAMKYKKPVIVYIGGCVYDTLKNMDSRIKKFSAPFMMLMIKEMARNAQYVHYVDEYLLDKYPTNGTYLICPSVRIDIDLSSIEDRKNKINCDKKEIIIGLIGYTHNKIKGIDTAIKALKILGDDYKLQIVGQGSHEWLDSLSHSLGTEKQISFLGSLKGREAIFNWLDTIDIYIQPSLTEGMPRATIEAMSRGCPVIASNAGGLKRIIDKKFIIEPGNYIELANKIRILTKNKLLMIEQAERNFNMSKRFDFRILDIKRDKFYSMIRRNLEKY